MQGEPEDDHATAERNQRARRSVQAASSWLFSNSITDLLQVMSGALPDVRQEDAPAEGEDWLHLNEDLPAWVVELADGRTSTRETNPNDLANILLRTLVIEQKASGLFNFRSQDGQTYRERSQAVAGSFDDNIRARVIEICRRLDLIEPSRPRHPTYERTLVLGGGFRSPLLRARYAAQLAAEGTEVGTLYFLGSPRFLMNDETRSESKAVADYAADAKDEYDLMAAAARAEFEVDVSPTVLLCGCTNLDRICPQWPSAAHPKASETPPAFTHERAASLVGRSGNEAGAVLSAHTSRPPYRPDTSDTFELWARYAGASAEERILVVTTQVFVPFQRFDGLRRLYLEHGWRVDTVGFGSEWGDRPLTAEYLLQETLSGIRSARRLLVAAIERMTPVQLVESRR